MNSLHRFMQSRGYIITLFAVLLLLSTMIVIAQVGASTKDDAKNGRLITIHDRGDEKVILTHAQTVRDALTDAGVQVTAEDQVEPQLDNSLVATDYTVNIYRARPVIVVDGMVRQKVMTAAQTPEGISKAAGVTLHHEDKTALGTSSALQATPKS